MTYQADGVIPKCPGICYIDECSGNPAGKMPKLSDDNHAFMEFFKKVQPFLGNGLGGFQTGGIVDMMNIAGIPKSHKSAVMDLFSVMILAYHEIKAIEDNNK